MSLLVGKFRVLDLFLFALRCLGRAGCVGLSLIVIFQVLGICMVETEVGV